MSRSYQFASAPQAVNAAPGGRQKYRDKPLRNMMFDRRIVRGNTYGSSVDNAAMNTFQPPVKKAPTPKRVQGNPRLVNRQSPMPTQQQLEEETAEPEQLAHEMLEELELPPEAADYVDPDRPVIKPISFIPLPKGTDVATHIGERDLYDYDLSVEPVLQVLVGRCLDQSLAEVLALKEDLFIRARLAQFELERQVGLATTKRMQAECLRKEQEKRRRDNQDREMRIRDRVTAHKLAARTETVAFMGNLQTEVDQALDSRGHYFNPVVKQVESTFVPWLLEQVQHKLNAVGECRKEVDDLLQGVLQLSMKDAQVVLKAKQMAFEEEKRVFDAKVAEEEAAEEYRLKLIEEERERAEMQAALEAAEAAGGGAGGDE